MILVRALRETDVADCAALLGSLPDWFGLEHVNRAYIESLSRLPAVVAEDSGRVLGFVALEPYGSRSAEIHVMAVDPTSHRRGVGRAMVEWARGWCRERKIPWLHVKTRGPATPDEHYERTRAFYLSMDFDPLFETLDLWGPEDAALILVSRVDSDPALRPAPQAGSEALVEFFFSPGSRYSYLASTQMAGLEAETGCRVEWRPVHGPDIRALRGRDPFATPLSGQYEPDYRRADAEAWAQLYGVPFREPREFHFDYRLLVRAAEAARCLGRVANYAPALARAVWADSKWPIDAALCSEVAKVQGIEEGPFRALLESAEIERALQSTAQEAFERGAFGVPTFFVGGQMFWGNDRLPLVRHALQEG